MASFGINVSFSAGTRCRCDLSMGLIRPLIPWATFSLVHAVVMSQALAGVAREAGQQEYAGHLVPEQARVWTLQGLGDHVLLLDCADCGDDIGAMLECRGRGEPARLSILWAAVDTEEALTESLRLEVAGNLFEQPAETTYAGQIGRFPQIRFGPDDPLVAALKADNEMKVHFAGVETVIGLRGFAAAFDGFNESCPWHPDQATQAHQGGDTTDAVAEDDAASRQPRWMLINSPAEGAEVTVASLSFGVPETDAVAFLATCETSNSKALVDVVAVVDVGDRMEGEAVDLELETDELALRLLGEVSTGQTTYPGVRAQIGHRHPLWAVLQVDDQVSLRADDGPSLTLPASRTNVRIEEFLAVCSN